MIRKHIPKVPYNKKASAPYNFIELPDKVVEAQALPNGNLYYPDKKDKKFEIPRHTGRIECTLTTSSPLYTRCGLTPKQFRDKIEAKDLPEFFYIDEETKLPVIPGSSLRGMMRTLVEIASFGKIERVSDNQRLFFRAVGSNPKKESWGKEYKQYVTPKQVKAGYLQKDNKGWYIQPAMEKKNLTFAWVKQTDINLPGFKKFDNKNYEPQYIRVSYKRLAWKFNKQGKVITKRLFADNVYSPDKYPQNQGVLVTSGNMKQGDEDSPRRNHCLIFEIDKNFDNRLSLDRTSIEHYRNALTDFQKQSPFDNEWGILQENENRPVFYSPPKNESKVIGFFGHSPNFRIPYSPEGDGHATTVVDFLPDDLKDIAIVDLADAIFGFARNEKQPNKVKQSHAGRVFFSDAKYKSDENGIWYTENKNDIIIPQTLASPKPTTFQHYLVQPEETKADKKNLKHYASKPVDETVIRGHKLYWHKGSDPDFKHPNPEESSDTQLTEIKPVKKGVTFEFTIYFENLSDVELGALMWVLDIARDDNYRLKLGMGKPLGMGAVKIESKLYLSDRTQRYTQLFEGNNWHTAKTLENEPDYPQLFKNYMLEKLRMHGKFKDICRIQMLLEMLKWEEDPSPKYLEQRRYMEIERDRQPRLGNDKNEYKDRRVLPTPLQVTAFP
ncbi:MAG: TIGR03986 family CRISPR-associated RAMP protein [Cyanobacteria bacterium SID2]|nr:TIGR03986 family CRISPR-associated RAMP protein [Cyanobacteria bacterium SID2]MBP0002355.1 TIGR03986 family CRISPR-associated RAMP protein [Cyanobacteria bacterium SBC]